MTSPAPTYEAGLLLIDQPLLLTSMSRRAHVTYAVDDLSSDDLPTVCDQLLTIFSAHLLEAMSTLVTAENLTGKLGDGTTVPAIANSSDGPTAGDTDLGNLPSPNVACLLKKTTGLAGKQNRGRMYLPWAFGENGISDTGLLTGDQVTTVQDAASAWLAALAGNNTPLVICNRTHSVNPTPPPAKYVSHYAKGAGVTALTLEAYAATQRRRMPR